jgi:hypothetical protein
MDVTSHGSSGLLANRKRACLWTTPITLELNAVLSLVNLHNPTAVFWINVSAGLIVLFALFLWCHSDAEQRGYPSSHFLSLLIVGMALVGVPYYLFRTRGFRGFFALARLFFYLLGMLIPPLLTVIFFERLKGP